MGRLRHPDNVIQCMRDLERYGIVWLTGEACAYGARTLCDLTEQGVRIVASCYGLQPDRRSFQSNWNSSSSAGTHVASFMLPSDEWKTLAVIALFESGCICVVHFEQELVGISQEQLEGRTLHECLRELREQRGEWVRTYTPINGPVAGGRCVHQMSGRSV